MAFRDAYIAVYNVDRYFFYLAFVLQWNFIVFRSQNCIYFSGDSIHFMANYIDGVCISPAAKTLKIFLSLLLPPHHDGRQFILKERVSERFPELRVVSDRIPLYQIRPPAGIHHG